MLKMVVLSVVIVVALLVGGFLAYRAYRQNQNEQALTIRTSRSIEESLFVRIGGIDQFVSIRGEDAANPVILVLHGGMGTSYVSFTPIFRSWEKNFTVVQWDRRGVGKTYGRNGRAGSGEMTLERAIEDGTELAEYLRGRLHKEKLILLGHSMGSMIGISMAAKRPDLFHAYVGTEQVIDMARNEAVSYQMMLERVRGAGNEKAIKTLERIGPPPYAALRDWGDKQQVAETADPAYGRFASGMFGLLMFSPAYSLKDLIDFVAGQQFSGSTLYSHWMSFDARRLGSSYATPIFIIQGPDDVMTPTALVREWFDAVQAPRKEFVPIDGGGHLVMATAADAYLAALLARVRPLGVEP